MKTDSELFDEFTVKIYEPPLANLRDTGAIRDLSNPVAVLMLVVDFETEVSMNGIVDFIGNETGTYADEIIEALKAIGCPKHADQLGEIFRMAGDAGMTHDAIQDGRRGLKPFAVASFTDIHGDKWEAATEAICEAEADLDYGSILEQAGQYLAEHRAVFEPLLSSPC